MLITKEIEIDMGHRVPNHKSKCRNLHGHRYRIEVGVDDIVIDSKGASDEGMVIDFSDLKEIMMDVLDKGFDHGFCVYSKDELRVNYDDFFFNHHLKIIFVDFVPTAENLAKHWYELLKRELERRNIKLHHVKVWETPSSTATYTQGGTNDKKYS